MENLEKINLRIFKNRNVLVTGATGIVGSWLIKDLLKLRCEITGLIYKADRNSELYRSNDIRRIKIVKGPLENIKGLTTAIKDFSIDTVFHLAAQAIVDKAHQKPFETFEANIRGTYNLLEACRINQRKIRAIIVASSDKAYGASKHLPYTEDMPLEGRQPYEVSKSCTDLLAQSYYHSYKLPIGIVRCGNIFGGGDLHWNRIVPGTIRSLLSKKRPIIRSDGSYVRDYIYVKDVSRALCLLTQNLLSEKYHGEAFNVSPQEPLTVLQIVTAIQKHMGYEYLKPVIQNIAKGEIQSQYLSSVKAKKLLHWKPRYSLGQGLKETISWYEKFSNTK